MENAIKALRCGVSTDYVRSKIAQYRRRKRRRRREEGRIRDCALLGRSALMFQKTASQTAKQPNNARTIYSSHIPSRTFPFSGKPRSRSCHWIIRMFWVCLPAPPVHHTYFVRLTVLYGAQHNNSIHPPPPPQPKSRNLRV